ncbi:MAG TPA: hypothetical protein PKC80_02330 [Burkholderiaceae bacterium]|nr:hypothetical protein [Burkholderiaceae bacterium]
MTISVSDYPSVADRIATLGCDFPESGVALLPLNFESATSITEFRQASEASTVRTLLRSAGLSYAEIVQRDKRPPYVHNNAFEWIAPTMFISAGVLSQNPNVASVALSVLANYVTDFFKGRGKVAAVKLDVVVETTKTKTSKRISYEGSPEGLRELAEVIREIANE